MKFSLEELATDVSDANRSQVKKYIFTGLFLSVVMMIFCPMLIPLAVFALVFLAGYAVQKKENDEREELRQQRSKREQDADIARQRRKPVRSEDPQPTRLMKVRRRK